MKNFEAAFKLAISLKPGSGKFFEISDQIRSLLSPKTSFPGIIGQLESDILQKTYEILESFSSYVFSNENNFKREHFSRAIDAYSLCSLCLVCIATKERDKTAINMSIKVLKDATNYCYRLVPTDLQYISMFAYNTGVILSKNDLPNVAIEFLDISKSICSKIGQDKLLAKVNRILAISLIYMDKTCEKAFNEALENADDIEYVIEKWISYKPPSNPRVIMKYLSEKKIPKRFSPFFALHGDFAVLSSLSVFPEFFPYLNIDSMFEFSSEKECVSQFAKCRHLYNTNRFLDCYNESLKLLNLLNKEKRLIGSHLAMFFLYYWIITSSINFGRPEIGIWYSKQMRKSLKYYPFTVGFALFLELKSKIHQGAYERLKKAPKIEFNCHVSWDALTAMHNALLTSFSGDENCFYYFEEVFGSNNDILKRDSFHYYSLACRSFGLYPDILDFEKLCGTSPESKALYIYHSAIEALQQVDIDKIWSYSSPLMPEKKLFDALVEASNYVQGNVPLSRKIKQLQALVLGTNDQIRTAELISQSISATFDWYREYNISPNFKIPFPILSISYVNIMPLEKCLLLAMYHPHSAPFVLRIKTEDKIDSFLDALDSIHEESAQIAPELAPNQWWKFKRELDDKLSTLLAGFQTEILGAWCGILTPMQFKPSQSAFKAALQASMNLIPSSDQRAYAKEVESVFGQTLRVGLQPVSKYPLALLLGKHMHRIPWESLPCVTNASITITRVPSMKLVAYRSLKSLPQYIDPTSSFYVLNPKGDLITTEQTLAPLFSKLDWEGIIQGFPDPQVIETVLGKRDLFVYCGHGSGREYYDYSMLINQEKHCRATMLLMGCSSGELTDQGELDPHGVPYYCMAAGASAVVANLWNVTDKDIDRFFVSLLEKAMQDGDCDLEEAVFQARSSCKLRFLTGASPVVYGFPTIFQKSQTQY